MINNNLREYTGDNIKVDGRMIGCVIVTAFNYLKQKNDWSSEEVEDFMEQGKFGYEIYTMINQILALKQSHWIMRRVSHSCGSLSDSIYYLKEELISKLKKQYDYDFDEEWVDSFGPDIF